MKFKHILVAAVVAAFAAVATSSFAQAYPNKPVRAIVPFSPGGGTDMLARIVLKALSESLGQAIVIENKAGAGGMVGWAEVARAPADGYTIGLGANTLPLLGEMYDSVPFNPKTAFEFVAPLATVPSALVANPGLLVHNIKELQAYAKKTGTPLAYGSPGIATPQHLAGALLARVADIDLRHVPYRGTSNAVTDVVGNHIPLAIVGLPQALLFAKSGQLRILGLASSKRSSLAPEVPTLAEGGLAGYESNYWWDIIVPRGTPVPIVQKLHDQMSAILRSSEMRNTLLNAGYEPMLMSGSEYLDALAQDVSKWTKIIRDNKIKLQGTN